MITTILLFLGGSALAGIMAGMLGIGGGAILVPLLLILLPMFGVNNHVMHIALATSLACIVFTTMLSSFLHYKRGSLDTSILPYWGVLTIIGGVFGSFWALTTDEMIIKFIYIMVMMIIIIYNSIKPDRAVISYDKLKTIGLGFPLLFGFISASIGIGGGNNVPALSLFGMKSQTAIGTACMLGVMVAVPSVFIYMYEGFNVDGLPKYNIGYVSIPSVFIITLITMITVPIGVRIAYYFTSKQLSNIFGVLSLILIINMILEII